MNLLRRARRGSASLSTPSGISWRRLLGYLRPYLGRMILALVAMVVYSAVNLIFPLLIGQIIGTVLQGQAMDQLNTLVLQLMVLFLIQAGFNFIELYQLTLVGEKLVFDIRSALFRHLTSLSFDFFATRPSGELLSRLSNDVSQVRQLLTYNSIQLLRQMIGLVGSLVLMFIFNTSLMVFIAVLVPALLITAIVLGRPLRSLSTQSQDAMAQEMNVATEAISGIRIVKSFTRELFEIARYDAAMQRSMGLAIRLTILRAAFGALMAFLGFGALGAVLWFSGREVLEGRLTPDRIVLFLIYGINVANALGVVANVYRQFQETLGATQRVFEVMDLQPSVKDAPSAAPLPPLQGHIRIEGVSFSYDERVRVLDDIRLDIAPGEIIALVGPSGAGKSTLFNLIPRFYDPTVGVIRIDGHDLREVTQVSLRSQIGMVPQETVLFGGTIRENIRYGRLEASEAELIEAAKAANAHDFIMSLPDKYETVVGERGIKLSGGQRQRVAIARALLKDPRILLLDEATSSLDSESEELVQEALNRLMQNRTTVIIAHRLSTVRIAHRICVLDQGKIVELGTHEELMAKGGLYSRFYLMQFREGETLLDAST